MSELLKEIRATCNRVKIEPGRRVDDRPLLRLDFRCPPKKEGLMRLNERLKRKFPGIKVGRTLSFDVVVFAEGEENSTDIFEAFGMLYEEKKAGADGYGKPPWYFPILKFLFGEDPLWHD